MFNSSRMDDDAKKKMQAARRFSMDVKRNGDDDELTQFTMELLNTECRPFRQLHSWSPLLTQFDKRQEAPPFHIESMTRWLRENREAPIRRERECSDLRRVQARAAVVRSIPDGAIGRRKRDTFQHEPTRAFPRSLPRIDVDSVACAPDFSPEVTCATTDRSTDQVSLHAMSASKRSPRDHSETSSNHTRSPVHRVKVTPRTYAQLSVTPKPETYGDGVDLIATILDSHFRHRNQVQDGEREKHSIQYRVTQWRNAMQKDMLQRRQDNLLHFLKVAQRTQQSEHGSMEDSRILLLYDGFVTCCARHGSVVRHGSESSPPAPASLAASVDALTATQTAFLDLAAELPTEPGSSSPITYNSFLTSIITQPHSSVARALLCVQRHEVLLFAEVYKATSLEYMIPPSTSLFSRMVSESTSPASSNATRGSVTFAEFITRQFPNVRNALGAVLRLKRMGALPLPVWVSQIFSRYGTELKSPAVSLSTEGSGRQQHVQAQGDSSAHGKGWTAAMHALRSAVRRHSVEIAPSAVATLMTLPPHSVHHTTHHGGQDDHHHDIPVMLRGKLISQDAVAHMLQDRHAMNEGASPLTESQTMAASIISRFDADHDQALNFSEFLQAITEDSVLRGLGRW